MFKKITFKNGLRIITVPDKKSKAATVLVLVGTGSKYEKRETNGMSHLLEHLLFKGTKKRPTPIDIVEPLDRVGGMYNAFTSEEYTGYYAKVSADNYEMALDIISDIYLNSRLDPIEMEKEKKVIVEEINMYYDNPISYVQQLWTKVLYGDQPAGWDIAGTKEGVVKITRDQISDYVKSQYVASNTVICIAGNVPSEENIINKVKKYFSNIKEDKFFDKPPVFEDQKEPNLIVHNRKTDQTNFCLGVRGFSLFDNKRYSQDILAAILGGMMSSRLFVRIREELGLAYYIKAASSSDTDTGYLAVQTGVDNTKAYSAVTAILEEFKKISKTPVPNSELKKAKENLKGRLDLHLETSDSQASFYGLQEILEKQIITPKEIYDRINKVSAKDILELSQNIFKPEKLNLAVVGPFEDESQFKKLLII